MSGMQAGEVFIDIAARLEKLDAGLAEAARAAIAGADKAAAGFSSSFSDGIKSGAEQAAASVSEALDEEVLVNTSEDAAEAGKAAGEAFASGFGSAANLQASLNPQINNAGQSSGQAFVGTFTQRVTRAWGAGGAEQLAGNFAKLFGPMAAAKAADALADFLRSDKSTPEALKDALMSIPFVGSFVNLGSAIYDATFGAADKAAEDLIAKEQAARAGMLRVAGEKEKEARADQRRQTELRFELQRLDIEQQVADIKAAGDERETAVAEARAKAAQMYTDLSLQLASDISDEEKRLLQERHDRRIQLMENELDLKLKAIDAEREAEKQKADDMARDAEQLRNDRISAADDAAAIAELELEYTRVAIGEDEKATKRAAAERDAKRRDMEREKAIAAAQSQDEIDAINRRFDAEQKAAELMASKEDKVKEKQKKAEREAQFQGESASTALGQFTFDPYPKPKMREVQERTMKGVEQLAAQGRNNNGFT